MDASTAECFDLSCGGTAFGKICLWGDISSGSSGVVRDLLVPPVKELLGICRSTLEVIDDKPVEGFVVESVIDLAPLRSALERKMKLHANIRTGSVRTRPREHT